MVRNVWLETGYLNHTKLSIIEEHIREMSIPSSFSFGRLPSSLHPCTKLTAEQWKNWVIYYSVFCLHDLLLYDRLECWRHFVLACRLMCKPLLSKGDVTVSGLLLLRFCKCFEDLYGGVIRYSKYAYVWPFSGIHQGLWTLNFILAFSFLKVQWYIRRHSNKQQSY